MLTRMAAGILISLRSSSLASAHVSDSSGRPLMRSLSTWSICMTGCRALYATPPPPNSPTCLPAPVCQSSNCFLLLQRWEREQRRWVTWRTSELLYSGPALGCLGPDEETEPDCRAFGASFLDTSDHLCCKRTERLHCSNYSGSVRRTEPDPFIGVSQFLQSSLRPSGYHFFFRVGSGLLSSEWQHARLHLDSCTQHWTLSRHSY